MITMVFLVLLKKEIFEWTNVISMRNHLLLGVKLSKHDKGYSMTGL